MIRSILKLSKKYAFVNRFLENLLFQYVSMKNGKQINNEAKKKVLAEKAKKEIKLIEQHERGEYVPNVPRTVGVGR